MERTTGYYNTFVVKIWSDEIIMRGSIEHIGTQENARFLSLEKMSDFILSHLCTPANDFRILDKIQGSRPLVSEYCGHISSDE